MDDLKLSDVHGKSVTTVYRVDEDESPVKKCIQTGEPICNMACYYRTRMGRVLNSLHNVLPLYSGKKLIGTICFIRPYNLLARELDIISEPGNTSAARKTSLPSLNNQVKQLNNGTRFLLRKSSGRPRNFGSLKCLPHGIQFAVPCDVVRRNRHGKRASGPVHTQ